MNRKGEREKDTASPIDVQTSLPLPLLNWEGDGAYRFIEPRLHAPSTWYQAFGAFYL